MGKQGAPKGNKNRVISEDQKKQGMTAIMSMPYEEWEAFKASCDLEAGAALDEVDYKDIWRRIDREARAAFIKQYHGLVDPDVMIV